MAWNKCKRCGNGNGNENENGFKNRSEDGLCPQCSNEVYDLGGEDRYDGR
jgi:hypothetical protein